MLEVAAESIVFFLRGGSEASNEWKFNFRGLFSRKCCLIGGSDISGICDKSIPDDVLGFELLLFLFFVCVSKARHKCRRASENHQEFYKFVGMNFRNKFSNRTFDQEWRKIVYTT